MPPKRKAAELEEALAGTSTARATRSTARAAGTSAEDANSSKATGKGAKAKPAAKKSVAAKKGTKKAPIVMDEVSDSEDDNTPPPPPKKARSKAVAKTSSKESVTEAPPKKVTTKMGHTSSKASDMQAIAAATKSISLQDSFKEPNLPYEGSRAAKMFAHYADSEAKIIDAEGVEKLCADADMPIDGVKPLILLWQLNAKVMPSISADEWTKGSSKLKMDSIPKMKAVVEELEMLFFPGTRKPKHTETYDRARHKVYVEDKRAAFKEFYAYLFILGKGESRNLAMEVALAFWDLTLVPKYPMAKSFVEFINAKSYKGVNKDVWSMLYEFCETVQPSLENFEADGAWPTMIDDFVEWKKTKTAEEGMVE